MGSGLLRRILELYTDFVLKNPFYEMEMPVRCELFDSTCSTPSQDCTGAGATRSRPGQACPDGALTIAADRSCLADSHAPNLVHQVPCSTADSATIKREVYMHILCGWSICSRSWGQVDLALLAGTKVG